MNSWQLAEDFRNGPWSTDAFGMSWRHEQDEQKLVDPAYPAAIVSAECAPFSANGKIGKFAIKFDCKSLGQDATAAAHADRVEEFVRYLFDQKSAVIAAVNALSNFTVLGYDAAPDNAGLEGNAFSTPIVINGTARQL